jgi:hypothetical protein
VITTAVSLYRLGLRAAADGNATLAATAMRRATQLDPSSNTPEQQQLASHLAVLQPQLQQQPSWTVAGFNEARIQQLLRNAPASWQQDGPQQQVVVVELDAEQIAYGLEETFSRQHAFTLLGCWCAVLNALVLVGVRMGVSLVKWAKGGS